MTGKYNAPTTLPQQCNTTAAPLLQHNCPLPHPVAACQREPPRLALPPPPPPRADPSCTPPCLARAAAPFAALGTSPPAKPCWITSAPCRPLLPWTNPACGTVVERGRSARRHIPGLGGMQYAKEVLERAKEKLAQQVQRAPSLQDQGQLRSASSLGSSLQVTSTTPSSIQSLDARVARFKQELLGSAINLHSLGRLSYHGIPDRDNLRATVWKLLLGYLPPVPDQWAEALARRRTQYHVFCDVSRREGVCVGGGMGDGRNSGWRWRHWGWQRYPGFRAGYQCAQAQADADASLPPPPQSISATVPSTCLRVVYASQLQLHAMCALCSSCMHVSRARHLSALPCCTDMYASTCRCRCAARPCPPPRTSACLRRAIPACCVLECACLVRTPCPASPPSLAYLTAHTCTQELIVDPKREEQPLFQPDGMLLPPPEAITVPVRHGRGHPQHPAVLDDESLWQLAARRCRHTHAHTHTDAAGLRCPGRGKGGGSWTRSGACIRQLPGHLFPCAAPWPCPCQCTPLPAHPPPLHAFE